MIDPLLLCLIELHTRARPGADGKMQTLFCVQWWQEVCECRTTLEKGCLVLLSPGWCAALGACGV